MNTEEKARAYDEVMDKIKPLYEQAKRDGNPIWSTYEYLIPELADSEDEKVRKWIASYIHRGVFDEEEHPMALKAIEYLEKQKEQPISITEVLARAGLKPYKDGNEWCILIGDNIQEGICGFGNTIDEALYQFLLEILEKQKAIAAIPDELVKSYKFFIENSRREIEEVVNAINGINKQKEQKPVTNEKAEMTDFEQSVYDLCPVLGIEEAKATASDLLELAKKTLLKTGKVVLASNYPEGCSFEDGFHLGYNEGFNAKKEQKPEEVDESTKRLNDNWMKQHFDNYEEQKPAEWSEEDEAFLKVAIAICNRYSHKDIADWLKSLPERFNLQPKQEWNEEDEDMLNCCISSIEEAKENRYAYKETDGDTSYDREIDWLKSLRPSWKPSEKQMNCLCAAVDAAIRKHNESVGGYEPARVLKSLYEDLQKLM